MKSVKPSPNDFHILNCHQQHHSSTIPDSTQQSTPNTPTPKHHNLFNSITKIQRTIIAFSVMASMPLIDAYPITGSGVNCRSGPGTSYDVVKSYGLGEDISITCQASGTDINGDELWDLTADGCYATDYYVSTGTSNYVTSLCDGGDDGSSDSDDGDLPVLDSTQSANASDIKAAQHASRQHLSR